MSIPVLNIYHMLCYSWRSLEQAEKVQIDHADRLDILNLLAAVLTSAVRRLVKRGLNGNYILVTDEINGVKGKFDVGPTVKTLAHRKLKAVCTFDEFSQDILLNRIIVSVLLKLLRIKGIEPEIHAGIKSLIWHFPGIRQINVEGKDFSRVKLGRNEKHYRFVLSICRLLVDHLLPSENPGEYFFDDFIRDERKMNSLFESFVRNFYKIKLGDRWEVRRESISWQFESLTATDKNYLPSMQTDITISDGSKKVIIDTKYYSKTLTEYYDSEKIHSANLYQLFAYLLNQENTEDASSLSAGGMLLYARTTGELNQCYRYKSHHIHIRTIDLFKPWQLIEADLMQIWENVSEPQVEVPV